jgi:predicted alpha/beta-fold hydrolase
MPPATSPPWLPGGNLQTIWAALASTRFEGAPPAWRRERWHTPDGDFVDADWLVDAPSAGSGDGAGRGTPLAQPAAAPLLVLFHGLEGSSSSHYSQSFAHWARRHGWRMVVPHFRGCSGELNLAPRAYHSGDYQEIGWMLEQALGRAAAAGPVAQRVAVGISLGGNALLRWAQEAGTQAAAMLGGIASISAPLDLAASGAAIGSGFNRLVYTRMFLRSMKPRALAKLAQHPGLFDRARLLAARDLYEFDNVFTAPLHGFRDTDDYWARAAAKPHLPRIRLPALVLNARNDPFVPASCLPAPGTQGEHVTLWQPAHGGHVGFPSGSFPGHVLGLPDAVMGWLQARR